MEAMRRIRSSGIPWTAWTTAQTFGYAGKASGGICCRRIKRPEENEGQNPDGADVKGEQAIEVLYCAV